MSARPVVHARKSILPCQVLARIWVTEAELPDQLEEHALLEQATARLQERHALEGRVDAARWNLPEPRLQRAPGGDVDTFDNFWIATIVAREFFVCCPKVYVVVVALVEYE